MNASEILRDFLAYERAARRISPHTSRVWTSYADRFVSAHGRRALTARALDAFFLKLGGSGLSDWYQLGVFKFLRHAFRWACERGRLRRNPMADMRPPIVRERPRGRLDKRRTLTLLGTIAACRGFHARRDHGILSACYWAGLRISEAVGLRVADYNPVGATLVVSGKGGRVRVAPIHPELTTVLRSYMRQRPAEAAGCPWLFPSNPRPGVYGKLDPTRVQRVLREKYAPRVKRLPFRPTPHDLRRGIAWHLHNMRGVPLDAVRRFLGHRRAETTQLYVQGEARDLRAWIRKA